MSSWVSHLPEGRFREVVGLGLNDIELAENRQLTSRLVHDLNRSPVLPFEDESFDGCVVTVSVQYLTRPVEVFAEVGRVLRADAPFVVTYSNRLFPTKAVEAWRRLDDLQHADLVGLYFALSGRFQPARAVVLVPANAFSDPLYAVVASTLPAPETMDEADGIRGSSARGS